MAARPKASLNITHIVGQKWTLERERLDGAKGGVNGGREVPHCRHLYR